MFKGGRQLWNSELLGSTVLLTNWYKGSFVGSSLMTIAGFRIHQGHLRPILVRESMPIDLEASFLQIPWQRHLFPLHGSPTHYPSDTGLHDPTPSSGSADTERPSF